MAAIWSWGCIKSTLFLGGTTTAGLPQSLKISTTHYPQTLSSTTASIWSVLISRILYIFSFSMFLISSFSCCARQQQRMDPLYGEMWQFKTVWFIKGILLASRGKQSPNQPTAAPVCPLNPHWPDHISAQAGNHLTSVVNHTHNTISICHFFPAQCWYGIDCCSRVPVSCADGALWCLMSRL